MPDEFHIICSNCGSGNAVGRTTCAACGHSFNPFFDVTVQVAAARKDETEDEPTEPERREPVDDDPFAGFEDAVFPSHGEVCATGQPLPAEDTEAAYAAEFPFMGNTFTIEQDLAAFIDRNFEGCLSLFNQQAKAKLTAWLLARGHAHKDVTAALGNPQTEKGQRLEQLRLFLDPGARRPEVESSHDAIIFTGVPRWGRRTRRIVLSNGASSGRLFGYATLGGESGGAFSLAHQGNKRCAQVVLGGGRTVISITAHGNGSRPGTTHRSRLIAETNGGRLEIPLSFRVRRSRKPAGYIALVVALVAILSLAVYNAPRGHGGRATDAETTETPDRKEKGKKTGTTVKPSTGRILTIQNPTAIREVRTFVESFFYYQSKTFPIKLTTFYAETVDYTDLGTVSKQRVREAKEALFDQWPEPKQWLDGPFSVFRREGADLWIVQFETRYQWRNEKLRRSREGRMGHQMEMVRDSGGGFLIIREKVKHLRAEPAAMRVQEQNRAPAPQPKQRDTGTVEALRSVVYEVLRGVTDVRRR